MVVEGDVIAKLSAYANHTTRADADIACEVIGVSAKTLGPTKAEIRAEACHEDVVAARIEKGVSPKNRQGGATERACNDHVAVGVDDRLRDLFIACAPKRFCIGHLAIERDARDE